MPWKQSLTIDERLRYVHGALSARFTMSDLCVRHRARRI
jgi:hypothetical protein